MAKIDKQELIAKVKELDGLTSDEKAQLIGFIKTKTYGLVWENSTEKTWEQLKDYIPVLVEDKSKAIINDTETQKNPNHILIEGDNLLALTNLCYTHAGMVDVIYIDPPYNTRRNDFKYNDNYVDPDGDYKHSMWLSFMGRRLPIAKHLLKDDGVIFISINEKEFAQLKLLCDHFFGEQNFLAHMTWESTTQPVNTGGARFKIQKKVESILCYAKNKDKKNGFLLEEIDCGLRYPHIGKLGACRFEIIEKSDAGSYKRDTMKFPILGQLPRPGKRWQIGEDTARDLEKRNRVEIVDGMIKKAVYPIDEIDKRKYNPFWSHFSAETVGSALTGKGQLNETMGHEVGFDTVKPVGLLKEILSHFPSDSVILDFFAGSGTTMHATMLLNDSDGGTRQCILCTDNENDICEQITYIRNKRVIEGYAKSDGEFVEGLHNNNLRYFKVGFTPRKKELCNVERFAHLSVPMLCIKEDVYKEQKSLGEIECDGFRYFKDGNKQFIAILEPDMIEPIVAELAKMDVESRIPVYVFTMGQYPYTEDFWQVSEKVELYPYPSCVYGACEKVMPKMEDKLIEQPEDIELSDEEANMTFDDLCKE